MKTEPLPKWIMRRYAKLWNAFSNRNFNFEKASNTLKEKDQRIIAIILSELDKYGWINIKQDPKDSRRRLYQLKKPNEAIKEMKNE